MPSAWIGSRSNRPSERRHERLPAPRRQTGHETPGYQPMHRHSPSPRRIVQPPSLPNRATGPWWTRRGGRRGGFTVARENGALLSSRKARSAFRTATVSAAGGTDRPDGRKGCGVGKRASDGFRVILRAGRGRRRAVEHGPSRVPSADRQRQARRADHDRPKSRISRTSTYCKSDPRRVRPGWGECRPPGSLQSGMHAGGMLVGATPQSQLRRQPHGHVTTRLPIAGQSPRTDSQQTTICAVGAQGRGSKPA